MCILGMHWCYILVVLYCLLSTSFIVSLHCANMPMQYAAIFRGCKNDNFYIKMILFLFLLKT